MISTPHQIHDAFASVFSKNPTLIVRAPGRINLIGEHTDYNDGFVLPAAIDKAIYFAIAPRTDQRCVLYSADLNDTYEFLLSSPTPSSKTWANFLIGVTAEITKETAALTHGFEVAFGGDVPLGAGLSSSAAVESGMGLALSELFGLEIPKMQLALLAQRAEHNFAGVKCGIMDMFASIHGQKDCVIRLDCRDLSYQYFPFDVSDYQLVLCNSGVKHSLADSAYNTRRQECEQGVAILKQLYPNIKSLRDVTLAQVEACQDALPANVFKRCRYVTGEIARVVAACEDLERGDFEAFGTKMYQTHQGLSQEYEVSCEELDFLVAQAQDFGLIGARMMGGGFGGCTLNLVKFNEIEDFVKTISTVYQAKYHKIPACYEVNITDGVSVIAQTSTQN
ncbi:MAG: galactokinase [Spirosomaceae bacterium]|nr:galactokinase [Spirosomataceae bacterium]